MDERIEALLQQRGVAYRTHRHEVVRTVAEAAERLPFPVEQFLKTIAFKTRDGRWLLVALRGLDRLDHRALAQATAIKRADLLQPSPDEVCKALGYESGGICPIPLRDDVSAFVDEAALALGKVYCGSGRADCTLEIEVGDLVQAAGARVVRIAAAR
jgi:Cys-tRNA(Pro)/Cys-tRNA(Cys) deacylase